MAREDECGTPVRRPLRSWYLTKQANNPAFKYWVKKVQLSLIFGHIHNNCKHSSSDWITIVIYITLLPTLLQWLHYYTTTLHYSKMRIASLFSLTINLSHGLPLISKDQTLQVYKRGVHTHLHLVFIFLFIFYPCISNSDPTRIKNFNLTNKPHPLLLLGLQMWPYFAFSISDDIPLQSTLTPITQENHCTWLVVRFIRITGFLSFINSSRRDLPGLGFVVSSHCNYYLILIAY